MTGGQVHGDATAEGVTDENDTIGAELERRLYDIGVTSRAHRRCGRRARSAEAG
jgi:hypothetical protein